MLGRLTAFALRDVGSLTWLQTQTSLVGQFMALMNIATPGSQNERQYDGR